MKRLITALSLVFATVAAFAQPFEGKILFTMDYPKLPDPSMASMMPKESVSYFKGGKTRVEMNMAMGVKNVTIADSDAKTAVSLIDMMGQKFAITTDANNPEAEKAVEEAKVTVTKDSKKIAGYNCTKAVIETKDGDKQEVWFTKDLKLPKGHVNGPMKKIDGSVLQYGINQNGMEMVLTAKEVVKEKVSDDKFAIPADYKKMTQEEFMKSMGGAK